MKWLLTPEVLNKMRLARQLGYEPTLEERREFAAAMHQAHARNPAVAGPRNLRVAGDVAQIDITGVLTEEPDCFALCFGGGNTTYKSIREALASADSDPAVKSIVLNVDSPGGTVHGLFETLAQLELTKKPMRSRASLAASAAYALVALAGPIEATTLASQFGSVGVAASIYLDEDVLDLASTEAPNKRPDLTTEEGQAVVRAELDAIHELFVDRIAAGRSFATGDDFDAKRVNTDFGRGGVLLAREAKKRGMVDSLPKSITRAPRGKNASAEFGGAEEVDTIPMNKETLKAQHPELYAAIHEEGRVAGVAAGTTLERDRVGAHLTMGEASGDMKTALTAIASGEGMTATLQAKYLAAGMNRNAQTARQTDSDGAARTVANAAPPAGTPASAGSGGEGGKDMGDEVADRVEAALGIKPKADKK